MNLSAFKNVYERENRNIPAMLARLKTLKKAKGDPHELMEKLN
jgi:hypothetical protein